MPTPSRLPRAALLAGGGAVLAVALAGGLSLLRADPDPGPALAATASTAPFTGTDLDAQDESPVPDVDAAPGTDSGAGTGSATDVPVQDASLDALPAQAPSAPVHLTLPTLGVDLPVDPVGVADDGQMEIPPHAERAGWYRFGPAPGAPEGTAIIAAHVDSIVSAGLGPFARLRDLASGDQVAVDLADGSTLAYRVDDVTAVPKTDVVWPDVFVRDGPARLVLVTCGGRWQPDVRHYADNVIVYLTPVATDGTA
ncbi:class F sortase [Actinotalea sp. M2MS4P-6]|uniref:class F sortase n=1 Tax=Actinotalea sp. M2MS4P-6 TaxID=2983762 RepID=UPI0021E44668|nr:class F sortase [Actinotalea sp. M2MS4P-6]MCV2392934.1 class F sortase [Actinotalea sp. M2MS4P-6]